MAVIDGLLHPELEFIQSRKYRNGYVWEVKKKCNLPRHCPRCSSPAQRKYGRAIHLVREQSITENPVWLRVFKHRYYCCVCRKPFTESTPGVLFRRRTTQRFRKWIKNNCNKFADLKTVARDAFCSEGFVYLARYEQLELKQRERANAVWPGMIGIDEHFFSRSKGYAEFVTIFTNLKNRKLFEVARGKSKREILEQVRNIPGRENVRIVCIDLSSGYRSLVKELFPNAQIVADKFHVVRLLSPEIIRTRKQIHGHRKELWTRRLLLKNRKDLDYDVRSQIDFYLKKHPELDELYRAKEALHQLYRCKGVKRAYLAFLKLSEALRNSGLPALEKLARTLRSWRDPILNYFRFKVTNGLTEAINGRAKALQKRACGYRSFKNYRLALLNACAF